MPRSSYCRKNVGFTTTELLVSLSILAVAASAVLPGISAVRQLEKNRKHSENLHLIARNLVEAIQADAVQPGDEAGLNQLVVEQKRIFGETEFVCQFDWGEPTSWPALGLVVPCRVIVDGGEVFERVKPAKMTTWIPYSAGEKAAPQSRQEGAE